MKTKLIAVVFLLTVVRGASGEMVVQEVTPRNMAEHEWSAAATRAGETTTFTFFISFERGTLPEGTSACLEVFAGKKVVCRSMLALQSERGKTFFRFTVGNGFLVGSKFTLTKIDVPHPSGDMYWVDLKKFAEWKKP